MWSVELLLKHAWQGLSLCAYPQSKEICLSDLGFLVAWFVLGFCAWISAGYSHGDLIFHTFSYTCPESEWLARVCAKFMLYNSTRCSLLYLSPTNMLDRSVTV